MASQEELNPNSIDTTPVPSPIEPVLVEADSPRIELENITDRVDELTRDHIDPSNKWLRRRQIDLPSGLTVVFAFTEGHQDGEFASIVESLPRVGKNITRKWDHKDSTNTTRQEVTVRTLQNGRYIVGETQVGFNNKDLNRMNKLIKDTQEHLQGNG